MFRSRLRSLGLQNLSSMDLISSHDSLVSLGLHPAISQMPALQSLYYTTGGRDHLHNSNLSLQAGAGHYSMPPHLTGDPSSEPDHHQHHQPILARFPSSLTSSNTRSNFQIYTQLQIPSTSNFGSMKKRKKSSLRDGESDLSEERSIPAREAEPEAEGDMVYVPDFISINNNKPVKV